METIINTLYFDIETIPLEENEITYPKFNAPANIKDPEKIAKAIQEKKDKYIEKAALHAESSKVCAIGYTTTDGWMELSSIDQSESEILQQFWMTISKYYENSIDFIAGWNIQSFDMPFIVKRSLVNGIELPFNPFQGRYLAQIFKDLMPVWSSFQYGDMIGLTSAATAIGCEQPREHDIQGKYFWKYWINERDHEKARQYLIDDLTELKAIGERMKLCRLI